MTTPEDAHIAYLRAVMDGTRPPIDGRPFEPGEFDVPGDPEGAEKPVTARDRGRRWEWSAEDQAVENELIGRTGEHDL